MMSSTFLPLPANGPLTDDFNLTKEDSYLRQTDVRGMDSPKKLNNKGGERLSNIERATSQVGQDILPPHASLPSAQTSLNSKSFVSASGLEEAFEFSNPDDDELAIENSEKLFQEFNDQTTSLCKKIKQLIDSNNTAPVAVDKETQDILNKFYVMASNYIEKQRKEAEEYKTFEHNFLALWEFLEANGILKNGKSFFVTADHLFPNTDEQSMSNSLGFLTKATDCIHLLKLKNCIPLLTNVVRYYMIKSDRTNLEDLHQRYQLEKAKLRPQQLEEQGSSRPPIDRIEFYMHQFRLMLQQDQADAKEKIQKKMTKFVVKLTALALSKEMSVYYKTEKQTKPFQNILKAFIEIYELIQIYYLQQEAIYYLQPQPIVTTDFFEATTAQEQLVEDAEKFFTSLVHCKTLEEVQQKTQQMDSLFYKMNIPVPVTFEEWKILIKSKRFKRQLFQCYYYAVGKKSLLNEKQIESILDSMKERHKNNLFKASAKTLGYIQETQAWELDKIRDHFAKLHMHIDAVKMPKSDLYFSIQSKADWDACIQDPRFCKALTKQWLTYNETAAVLAIQALRQALLSKHTVESEFIWFRTQLCVLSIASSIVQIILGFPQTNLWLTASAVEIFTQELNKLQVPGMGVVNILYPLHSDFNLSLESIGTAIAMHFFAIKYKPNEYSAQSYQLWLEIRWYACVELVHFFLKLVEEALLWLNMRLIENCVMHIKNPSFEKDPRAKAIAEKYEAYYDSCKKQKKELEEAVNQLRLKDTLLTIFPPRVDINNEKIDPIKEIAKALQESDLDYLPVSAYEFLENQFGFTLTNGTKDRLQEHLKAFFSTSGDQFIASSSENRFHYLNKTMLSLS